MWPIWAVYNRECTGVCVVSCAVHQTTHRGLIVKLVVLDRDGVINEEQEQPIKTPDDWVAIDGSIEAIASLCQADYQVVVVTNQSAISHGMLTVDEVNVVHQHMQQTVVAQGGRIDAVMFCPHKPGDDCNCRKPKPGMLHSLMERLDIDLNGVPLVGDSLRDVQLAMVVGATPVLVKTGHGTLTIEENKHLEGVDMYENLAEFVEQLLATETE